MFVVRTIKKNKESTDERTSLIKNHSNKVISILSGKWNKVTQRMLTMYKKKKKDK